MRIGFIGLGRMGANMVRRLVRDGHEIVVYNRTPEKTTEIAGGGRDGRRSRSPSWSPSSRSRGRSGSWSRPATRPRRRSTSSSSTSSRATRSSTAATRTSTTTSAATRCSQAKGIGYVDAGTSGGIWGLQVGYCLMVGGDAAAVDAARADLHVARPGGRLPPRRRPGRRALREDGPQRHRVRPDAGLRRGLRDHARERLRARPRRDLRAVDAGLGRALVAARARRARVPGQWPGPRPPQGLRRRLRARAAGPSRRRSTTTSRRRSSRSRC